GGAAGNGAAEAAAKSPGDGYTLLFAQSGRASSAAAVPNLPYSAERDLVPLSPVAATPHILIVAPDFPAKNVQELIARAKAEPGKLSFASSGVGNSDHLCGELFNLMAGISAIHVPYKRAEQRAGGTGKPDRGRHREGNEAARDAREARRRQRHRVGRQPGRLQAGVYGGHRKMARRSEEGQPEARLAADLAQKIEQHLGL